MQIGKWQMAIPYYFSFSHFLAISCYFWKLRLSSFNSRVNFKWNKPNVCRLNVLVCCCTGLTRVNKTKLTSGDAIIVDLLASAGKKGSKYDERTLIWSSPGVLTCFLTLSLRKTHICVFPDYISFSHFLSIFYCF